MKTIKILIILLVFTLFSNFSMAETKINCSEISTKSLTGIFEKKRCEKGLPPKEKINLSQKLKKLNPFKKKK